MKVCWLVFCTLLLAGTTGYSQPPEITSQKKWNRIYFQSYDCDFSTAEVKKITKTPSPMFYTDNNQKTNNLTTLVLDLGYKKILSDMPNPGLFAHDQSPHPIRDCSPVFFFDFKEDFATDDIQSMLLVSKTDGKERSKPIKFELADLHSKQSLDWKYPTITRPSAQEPFLIVPIHQSRHPQKAWDLVILGDGFTSGDYSLNSSQSVLNSQLGKKVKQYVEYLFSMEPFKHFKDHINVKIVATHSNESGLSNQEEGKIKDTYYGLSSGENCVDRRMSVDNLFRVYEMASKANYDHIAILANESEKSAGSAHFGEFWMQTLDDDGNTFAHEVGHALGELYDTYDYNRSSLVTGIDAWSEKDDLENCTLIDNSQHLASQFDSEFNFTSYSYDPSEPHYNIVTLFLNSPWVQADNIVPSFSSVSGIKYGEEDIIAPHYPLEANVSEKDDETFGVRLDFGEIPKGARHLTIIDDNPGEILKTLGNFKINGTSVTPFKTLVPYDLDGESKQYLYLSFPPTKGVRVIEFDAPKSKIEKELKYRLRSNLSFQFLSEPLSPIAIKPILQGKGIGYTYTSAGEKNEVETKSVRPSLVSIYNSLIKYFNEVEQRILSNKLCTYTNNQPKHMCEVPAN